MIRVPRSVSESCSRARRVPRIRPMSRVTLLVRRRARSALSAVATTARAEIQARRPRSLPVQARDLGAHSAFRPASAASSARPPASSSTPTTPTSFHPFVWFDANLANVFGFGSADGLCAHSVARHLLPRRLGARAHGRRQAQVRHARIPLVIEAPVLVGVEVLYNRDCGDNGAAVPVLKTGGGVEVLSHQADRRRRQVRRRLRPRLPRLRSPSASNSRTPISSATSTS